MNNEIITIYEDGKKKNYKLLLVIDKDYKYVIYTKKENKRIDRDLYVAKVRDIGEMNETMTITDKEWQMIIKEYNRLLKIKTSLN